MFLDLRWAGLLTAFLAGSLAALAEKHPAGVSDALSLPPASCTTGFVARLLINEVAFPGERGFSDEADSRAAMAAILHVLDARLNHVPPGYRAEELRATRANDLAGIIVANDGSDQCTGFFRDETGRLRVEARVEERLDHLLGLARKAPEPTRVTRLLAFAHGLAEAYLQGGIDGLNRYEKLSKIDGVAVTGRAYAWQSDRHPGNPGEGYVAIPDAEEGRLGGNRFYTLRQRTL
jgi:hypothetical protein